MAARADDDQVTSILLRPLKNSIDGKLIVSPYDGLRRDEISRGPAPPGFSDRRDRYFRAELLSKLDTLNNCRLGQIRAVGGNQDMLEHVPISEPAMPCHTSRHVED